MKKYLGYHFSTGSMPGEDYLEFQKKARTSLRKMLKTHGINLHTFSKNHYEFSAVAERDGKFAYISISDVRFFQDHWFYHVLFRTMSHDKDWTGGSNHYCKWPELGAEIDRLLS